MLIVCPSCGIKYNVPESYLKKDRTLKCASCGTSWVVPAIRETGVPADTHPSAGQIPVSEPPKAEPVAEKTQEPASSVEQTSSVTAPVAETPKPEVKPEAGPDVAEAARIPEPPIQEPPAEPPPAPVQEPPPAEPLPEPLSEKPEPAEPFAETAAPHHVFEEVPEPEAVPPEIHLPEKTAAPDGRHEEHAVHVDDEHVFSFPDEESGGTKEDHIATPNEPSQIHAHEEAEKPFSFLDAEDDHVVHRGQVDEEKPADDEDSGGFIDWDEHEKETARAQSETSASPSHEWDEKDLDSHFDDANWHAHTGVAESLAEEPADLDRFETGVHGEVPWARPDVLHADSEDASHVSEADHQPVDGQFDEVINRIRASRKSAAGGLETPAAEAPKPQAAPIEDHQAAAATPESNEPWVPAWERTAQAQPVEETQPPPQVEAHEEAPIWDIHPAATEQQQAVEEEHAPVEKEAVSAPEAEERHVTAAADISSRLRNDVLNRVASKDSSKPGNSGSLLESPAFWRKAWIASGVGAAVGLAACVHWFSALRHVWPALNLL